MLKPDRLLSGMALALLCVSGLGCPNNNDPVAPVAPPPVQTKQTPPVVNLPPASFGQPTLKEALEQHLAAAGLKGSRSAIPAGTRLLSVSVSDGVAAVDVSKEFNTLANRGETVESHAQKELRALLAQFADVKKMRLTVEGKAFDSQATDWNTPFPVRDTDHAENGDGSSPSSGRGDR